MVQVTITVQDLGAGAAMAGIAARAADLRPAMDDVGGMLLTSTAMHFERESDPDGHPWTPLAPATVKQKAKSGHEKILQVSGRLSSSITAEADADSVTIGTNILLT